ncbi:aminotransferase [Corynebacterium atypicum]|uniref:Aminotransferase n=1 Tax=Corynebacterium atypicum TaxID=191610 RepID=A0ABM5QKY7_9CORY|nr:histidinol-phosphate transaminase [Corynebacterium atypicum]AIG63431.1 aminotransferase [Corynebacterium atypicum]
MIRPDLDRLPSYAPGKRQEGALKLSSNEVPFPPLQAAVEAMSAAAAGANRYPPMPAQELVRALAAQLGLDASQVAVGCGSSALCQQLVQITSTAESEVIFPWRSFEAYPIFAQVVGATPVAVPLTATGGLDLDAMTARITDKTSLVFICNPNNPSGQTVTTEEFARFMAQVPERVTVALDEAYFEFNRATDTPVATEEIARHANVVGLRTFSKAYGLAGARVGYVFGAEEIISALDKVAIPFALSTPAQAGALASLSAREELLARVEEIVSDRDRVADLIGAEHSQANFLWLPTPEGDADFPQRVASKLADAGVLVRAFPEGVRVTVSSRAENDRLLKAWQGCTSGR